MSARPASCTETNVLSDGPQAVAEMLVRNESRIKMIHDIQHFHVPRQLLHTIRIRLEVRVSPCERPHVPQCPQLNDS